MKIKILLFVTLASVLIFSCQKTGVGPKSGPSSGDDIRTKMLSYGFKPYEGIPAHADTLTPGQVAALAGRKKTFSVQSQPKTRQSTSDYYGTYEGGPSWYFPALDHDGWPSLFTVYLYSDGSVQSSSFPGDAAWGYFHSNGSATPYFPPTYSVNGTAIHYVFAGTGYYYEYWSVMCVGSIDGATLTMNLVGTGQ